MAQPGSAGIYAEVETRRLSAAFDGLFYSLADRRIVSCARKRSAESPTATNFRANSASFATGWCSFCVDVCRPSQLARQSFFCADFISPACGRWWYTIRRWMLPAIGARSPFEAAGGATGIFRTGFPAPAAGAPLAQTGCPPGPADARCRNGFFWPPVQRPLLRDENALGARGSSTKTSMLRRVLLAWAAALCLLFAIGFTVSYFGNRALENKVLEGRTR